MIVRSFCELSVWRQLNGILTVDLDMLFEHIELTGNIDIELKTVYQLYIQLLHLRGILVIYLNPEVKT